MLSLSKTACLRHSINHEFTRNLITLILAHEYEYKELHYGTFQSYSFFHKLYNVCYSLFVTLRTRLYLIYLIIGFLIGQILALYFLVTVLSKRV